MKISLSIPVKNEIEGIKVIMPRIKKEWVDEIVIVDGNSTDGTREWLEERGYKVIPQTLPGAIGGYWQSIAAATGDIVILFSPDGNSIPELIPALIEKMKEGYDMVAVSRYKDAAKSRDDFALSALGNRLFTGMVNLLFGVRYTDVLVIFRGFRRELLTKFGFDETTGRAFNKSNTSMFELLLSVECARRGLKVADIPGDEPPRIGDVGGSRLFPHFKDRVYGGLAILYYIVRGRFTRVPREKK